MGSVFSCFSKTSGKIGEYITPKNPIVMGVAMFAGWYFRRVFLTYGPGLLADFCIHSAINSLGSDILGKAVGGAFVAPVMVPTLTPIVATVVGGVAAIILVIIGNIFSDAIAFLIAKGRKCFQKNKGTKQPETV